MRPKLYGRLTERLVFNRLSYDVQVDIVRLRLEEEIAFYAAQDHRITAGQDVLNFLVRGGCHPRLSARPVRGR